MGSDELYDLEQATDGQIVMWGECCGGVQVRTYVEWTIENRGDSQGRCQPFVGVLLDYGLQGLSDEVLLVGPLSGRWPPISDQPRGGVGCNCDQLRIVDG